MSPDRRQFLAAASAAVTGGLRPPLAGAADTPPKVLRPNRIAVSTYSFWQFKNRDLRDIETCIDLAAEMGFDGVEILHRQMEDESNATLQAYKRRAFLRMIGYKR